VQNKNLVLATTKNDEDILVPLSDKVLEILERNDYNFSDQNSSNFNVVLEKICMKVPSLCEPIEVKRYVGSKTPIKTEVPKYKKITSHVGRKSLINNALIGGVPAPAIASIVGHQGVNLVLSTYGSGAAGRDKIRTLYELSDNK
jgi:integrase